MWVFFFFSVVNTTALHNPHVLESLNGATMDLEEPWKCKITYTEGRL